MAKLTGTMKSVADEIDAVLAKHGITRENFRVTTDEFGGIRFSITAKTQVKNEDGTIDPFAKEKAEFKTYHSMFGFEESWLGLEFNYGGKVFKLEGFNMGKMKNKVVLSQGSKRFVAPAPAVIREIGKHLGL